ncbi:uncharacterized protein TRIVIDRAFT_218953 [Trichoderma virens Gv29-8]|uniref:Uncharacterized protein n=1 Tax=Hypocrea virens (strain Gv29-8 / FGSC 10586) TaxID=413071 RepID=G9MI54_HYPVG|nr:uncharacterized protein TRIVIDRAFT_218953 [Trichoderma virens Gv29-8]EHK25171.1 hypothetical protein TRIVIDRAFT_218953 [Trichoderma virens Gv29-8]
MITIPHKTGRSVKKANMFQRLSPSKLDLHCAKPLGARKTVLEAGTTNAHIQRPYVVNIRRVYSSSILVGPPKLRTARYLPSPRGIYTSSTQGCMTIATQYKYLGKSTLRVVNTL